MRLGRTLRATLGRPELLATATLLLGLGVACGGGAAPATPTTAPTTAPAAPVASPATRPPLVSPASSPPAAATTSPSGASTSAPSSSATSGPEESYEVQPGDTLAIISQQYYGDPTQWRRIYDANKDAIGPDPDKLKLGTKLTIPPKPS
jgi:nucleoid-associated protein YgaU